MKTLLTGLIALFAFTANAQLKVPSHLYIKAEAAMMENKQRNIFDVGISLPHSRISVYTENFMTDRPVSTYRKIHTELPDVNYRKWFLGVRYSHVIKTCSFNIVPSLGIDIRLNGVNTKKTASRGLQATTANMPSLRPGMAIERALSQNQCNPLNHISLALNTYSQLNISPNFGKQFRPGIGIGTLITF